MKYLSRTMLAFALFFFASTGYANSQTASKVTGSTAATSTTSGASLLDINTATPAQLKSLRGIGDAYAKRIIDGRPYTAKNQLTTRGILPQATYDSVKDQIIARAPKK